MNAETSISGSAAFSGPIAGLHGICDAIPVAAFVIDGAHTVVHWNRACEKLLGLPAQHMLGHSEQWRAFYSNCRPVLADLVLDGVSIEDIRSYYSGASHSSATAADAVEAEVFFPHLGAAGRWLHITAAVLRDPEGAVVGSIETMLDITDGRHTQHAIHETHAEMGRLMASRTAELVAANQRLGEDIRNRLLVEAALVERNHQLTEVNEKLSNAQSQLMQSEKLASIGQLAAGVAHEINNPIGYIFSNFTTLRNYLSNVFTMLAAYRDAEAHLAPELADRMATLRHELDLEFLQTDIPALMDESDEGIQRVRAIVQDLKDFSRAESSMDWQWSNLQRGIESTLNIVNNEVKYIAEVRREFTPLPDIECLPSQINQVILNLVVNAAHAISSGHGLITIRTGVSTGEDGAPCVWFDVADNGCGMTQATVSRIFDPFFTTKPVGKGTGLGLALSYRIVEKHRGRIEIDSEPGKGSRFRVTLPVHQSSAARPAGGDTP